MDPPVDVRVRFLLEPAVVGSALTVLKLEDGLEVRAWASDSRVGGFGVAVASNDGHVYALGVS